MEVDTLHATGKRQAGILRIFLMSLCTGYSGSTHSHASTYRIGAKSLLFEARSRVEFIGGYHIRVGEDGYSLSVDQTTSDE